MTKIFNNRPLFYCFLALGLGIFLAKPIFSFDIPTIVFFIFVVGAIAFLCIKYRKIYRLLLIFACFCIGIASFFISVSVFDAKSFGSGDHEIVGRVCVATVYDSSERVILDNVYVDGERIGENISVFVYLGAEIEEGQVITFKAEITKQGLFTLGQFNSYNYKYNIPYSCSVGVDDITIDNADELNWSQRLRIAVKGILFNNMNADAASVSYASLFGDKTNIPNETKEAFSITGIAHLLAVSGLHVGFVVAVLSFILKKLKINRYVKVGILASLLFAYCYLCSFSASVVRASIMFLIMDLALMLGYRYDRLNSWSLAGIVCLLFRPLSVYDGGFLLSFACVFCVFMFARPLQDILSKWRIPKSIASSLGVMIPVQLGLLPLLSNYFSEVSILSIIANLIAVPVFEIFFILLFILVPIVLVIPVLKFILVVPEVIIGGIIGVANFLAGVDWAIINLTAVTSLVIIGIYATLFICSHFTNIKVTSKFIVTWCVIVFVATLSLISTYKTVASDGRVSVLNVYRSPVYCLELNGHSFCVGEFDSYSIARMEQYATKSRLYNYDYFISINSSLPKNENNIFTDVYTCGNTSHENFLQPDSESNFGGVEVIVTMLENECAGIIFSSKDLTIFICANQKFTEGMYLQFSLTYGDFDLVMGEDIYLNPYLNYINYDYCISSGANILQFGELRQNVSMQNWTFNLGNSKLYNIRGVD